MAEARNQGMQNTGVVDLGDEEELTVINGETIPTGRFPQTAGRLPEGAPPSAPSSDRHDDLQAVEAALGNAGNCENHPDGPGVGGD
jgi:hypothetical protein